MEDVTSATTDANLEAQGQTPSTGETVIAPTEAVAVQPEVSVKVPSVDELVSMSKEDLERIAKDLQLATMDTLNLVETFIQQKEQEAIEAAKALETEAKAEVKEAMEPMVDFWHEHSLTATTLGLHTVTIVLLVLIALKLFRVF